MKRDAGHFVLSLPVLLALASGGHGQDRPGLPNQEAGASRGRASEIKVRLFVPVRADAGEAVARLKEVFRAEPRLREKEAQGPAADPARLRIPGAGAPRIGPPRLPAPESPIESVQAIRLEEKESILVAGTEEGLSFVKAFLDGWEEHPAGGPILRRYALRHARPTSVGEILGALFVSPPPRRASENPDAPQGAPPPPAATPEIRVLPDLRDGALVVAARPQVLAIVDSMVGELDRDLGSSPVTRVYPLKFADPVRMMRTLQSIFQPEGPNSGEALEVGGRGSPQESVPPAAAGPSPAPPSPVARPSPPPSPEIVMLPDSRAGTLTVVSPGHLAAVVGEVILQLDQPDRSALPPRPREVQRSFPTFVIQGGRHVPRPPGAENPRPKRDD
jgi:hypothetical protein